MTRFLALAVLLTLTACGVDGPPSRPADKPKPDTSGGAITITGNARVGVTTTL